MHMVRHPSVSANSEHVSIMWQESFNLIQIRKKKEEKQNINSKHRNLPHAGIMWHAGTYKYNCKP